MFGYHLVNLTVHLLTAVLVWRLVLLTLATPAMKEEEITGHANVISLLAGLVFVAHPVQTESVTYIVQRASSMATLFYVASLCSYIKWREIQEEGSAAGSGRSYFIGSLIMAMAAMFTKEIAITLPLMILFYEFSFFKTKKGVNWKRLVPFLLTIFIIPLTMLLTETGAERAHELQSAPGISLIHYFLTQFRVISTYIRLVFLPVNQNLDYDYSISRSAFEVSTAFGFLFLTAILFFAQRLFFRYRLVSFFIFWFFLTLLPESSFLPIQDVIFEHRLYLPLVGYSIFLVSGIYYLFGKNTIKMTVVALMMIVACNAVLTYRRNMVWKDELTLWEDTLQKSPHKARPYAQRGLFYDKEGDLNRAMADYNKAIGLSPDYYDAYNNRGIIYAKQGAFIQAMADFNKAIEIKPGSSIAYNNRGSAYDKQGNLAQAMSDYNKAIEINPDYAEAYNRRGSLYDEEGDLIHAISDYNKAIGLIPDHYDAYNNRGISYAKQDDFTQAVSDFSKAIEISPENAEAYNNRAFAYYYFKEYDKSWIDVQKAELLGGRIDAAFLEGLKQASGR